LTPFGEYIPLRSLARIVSPLVDEVEDFSPGDSGKTFEIGAIKVAPVICYELIDDALLEKAAQNSNILAVQTNSATFGMSAESAQQLSITRVRAIEILPQFQQLDIQRLSTVREKSFKKPRWEPPTVFAPRLISFRASHPGIRLEIGR
jgi:hypothetical protein